MVNLVPAIECVGNHLSGWSVCNSGRDDVGHVSVVLVLAKIERWVGIELSNCSKMHITAVRQSVCIYHEVMVLSYLRIVTRIDFSAARSCRSSIKYFRSNLCCFAVQWSSNISTFAPCLLTKPPKSPAFPRDCRLFNMFFTMAYKRVSGGVMPETVRTYHSRICKRNAR